MQGIFSLRANRETWLNFVCKVKKERKCVWDVLEPMITKYLEDKQICQKEKNT